jgi:hypothetical protein
MGRSRDPRDLLFALKRPRPHGQFHEHPFRFELRANAFQILGVGRSQLRKIHLASVPAETMAEVDEFFRWDRRALIA